MTRSRSIAGRVYPRGRPTGRHEYHVRNSQGWGQTPVLALRDTSRAPPPGLPRQARLEAVSAGAMGRGLTPAVARGALPRWRGSARCTALAISTPPAGYSAARPAGPRGTG